MFLTAFTDLTRTPEPISGRAHRGKSLTLNPSHTATRGIQTSDRFSPAMRRRHYVLINLQRANIVGGAFFSLFTIINMELLTANASHRCTNVLRFLESCISGYYCHYYTTFSLIIHNTTLKMWRIWTKSVRGAQPLNWPVCVAGAPKTKKQQQ